MESKLTARIDKVQEFQYASSVASAGFSSIDPDVTFGISTFDSGMSAPVVANEPQSIASSRNLVPQTTEVNGSSTAYLAEFKTPADMPSDTTYVGLLPGQQPVSYDSVASGKLAASFTSSSSADVQDGGFGSAAPPNVAPVRGVGGGTTVQAHENDFGVFANAVTTTGSMQFSFAGSLSATAAIPTGIASGDAAGKSSASIALEADAYYADSDGVHKVTQTAGLALSTNNSNPAVTSGTTYSLALSGVPSNVPVFVTLSENTTSSVFYTFAPTDEGSATATYTTNGMLNAWNNDIDWPFIASHEGASYLNPYIPNSGSGSGVTIASGVDLGTGPIAQALGDGLNLISDLFPEASSDPDLEWLEGALGRTGPNAQSYLDNTPLPGLPIALGTDNYGNTENIGVSINPSASDLLDDLSQDLIYDELIPLFNSNHSAGIADFTELPGEIQTAVADVAYNYGPDNLPHGAPNFWAAVLNEDWGAAEWELTHWNGTPNIQDGRDSLPRFTQDAAEMEKGSGVGPTAPKTGPAAPNTPPIITPTANLNLVDTTTGQPVAAVATPYSGPVAMLQNQYIYTGTDNVNITVTDDNWFLKGGPGEDALQAFGGYNVLDGSTGSNFLTGGSGTDTFFVDDRSPPSDIWSTVNNFHQGDDATVFGIVNSPAIQWFDNQGAPGFTGLTLHVFGQNAPTASLTLVGYSSSDLGNGRLSVQFGSETDGTPFMHIVTPPSS